MKSLIEVFYQPGAVFSSLPERKAPWVVPMIVDVALLFFLTVLTIRLVGMETIMRQRLEYSNVSPEQMQAALSRANSPVQVYASYAGAIVGTALTIILVAGLLLLFALMTNRQPKFTTMMAMVAIAFFPYWLITGIMTVLILMASSDRASLNLSNLIATNIGAY